MYGATLKLNRPSVNVIKRVKVSRFVYLRYIDKQNRIFEGGRVYKMVYVTFSDNESLSANVMRTS